MSNHYQPELHENTTTVDEELQSTETIHGASRLLVQPKGNERPSPHPDEESHAAEATTQQRHRRRSRRASRSRVYTRIASPCTPAQAGRTTTTPPPHHTPPSTPVGRTNRPPAAPPSSTHTNTSRSSCLQDGASKKGMMPETPPPPDPASPTIGFHPENNETGGLRLKNSSTAAPPRGKRQPQPPLPPASTKSTQNFASGA